MTTINLVVDPETGEVLPGVFNVAELIELRREVAHREDIIAGLQRDIRGWAQRYRELERDRKAEALEHELWPVGQRVFSAWRKQCRHPRSVYTADRFWQIEPFLTHTKYGKTAEDRERLCMRAIAGAAFDAFVVKRKNGSVKRFDEWERIFESAGKFEEFCNRAPRC